MIHQDVQIAGDCDDIVADKLDDPPSEIRRAMTSPYKVQDSGNGDKTPICNIKPIFQIRNAHR